MYLPSTTWTRLFFLIAVAQGLSSLALEAYVFVTVENDLDPAAYQVKSGHTVPMYFALFIFSFVYGLVIVYDALRRNSMIQVIGLCTYNVLLFVHAAIQPQHVKEALDTLSVSLIMGKTPILPLELQTWQRIRPALIAVITIQAAATVVLGLIAHKLHSEFAWLVYKVIHADISMRRRLFTFQIYMAFIKFDFFFFLGFLIQVITLIIDKTDVEFGISIAAVFVALGILFFAIDCATVESRAGTIAVLISYIGAVVYLCYKLAKLWEDTNYILITFAAISLVMMVCTIGIAITCMSNFDRGLKIYTLPQKKLPSEDICLQQGQSTYYLSQSSRMNLDS